MSSRNLCKFALVAIAASLSPGGAQAQAPGADYSYSPTSPGSWGYVALNGGSEARFMDSTGTIRLAIGCTRAARQVTISRTSTAPAAALSVWTSGGARNLPARFDQNSFRVSAQLNAYDTMLDAIAFTRGRFALAMPGAPALVVTSSPEAARIVEDCRA